MKYDYLYLIMKKWQCRYYITYSWCYFYWWQICQ